MNRAVVMLIVLLGLSAPCVRGSGFNEMKSIASKVGSAKEKADENQISEEQFYRCFSDINCYLGESAHEEINKCYAIPSAQDAAEYVTWFLDSPKGDFNEQDMSIQGINTKFCKQDRDSQRIINDHFALKASEFMNNECKEKSRRNQCLRLKKGTECLVQTTEIYVTTGKCETIVNEAPIPDEMKTAIGEQKKIV